MAIVKLTPSKIANWNEASNAVSFTALNTGDGAYYEHTARDDRNVILVQNSASSASNLTIKKGNGLQGVADEVISIPASSTVAVAIESGRFKNVSGDNKGRVILTGASTLLVGVVEMP